MLTGKAKEDFLSYVYGQGLEDLLIRDISLHALIIDWLDSFGIYVSVVCDEVELKDGGNIMVFESYVNSDIDSIWGTRQEAVKQAILKANDIYNGRN